MTDFKPQFSTEKPPVWDALVAHFNPSWERTIVAYADTIYAKHPVPPDIVAHEMIHLKQQGYRKDKAKEWWTRYLKDPQFRYSQEVEAYQEQYRYLKRSVKDRNELARKLHKIAWDLANRYGLEVSLSEALKVIKQ